MNYGDQNVFAQHFSSSILNLKHMQTIVCCSKPTFKKKKKTFDYSTKKTEITETNPKNYGSSISEKNGLFEMFKD